MPTLIGEDDEGDRTRGTRSPHRWIQAEFSTLAARLEVTVATAPSPAAAYAEMLANTGGARIDGQGQAALTKAYFVALQANPDGELNQGIEMHDVEMTVEGGRQGLKATIEEESFSGLLGFTTVVEDEVDGVAVGIIRAEAHDTRTQASAVVGVMFRGTGVLKKRWHVFGDALHYGSADPL